MATAEMKVEQGAEAGTLALRNWDANCAALAKTQAELVRGLEGQAAPTLEWVFARDGFLSARNCEGSWICGCSVPRLAARELMKEVKTQVPVTCFVGPTHAAQLQVALEQMSDENQSIVAIVESMEEISVILCCQDFSEAIARHRLFFAAGEDWEAELSSVFQAYPGLPTPTTFLRLVTTEPESADGIISKAQKIISQIAGGRTQEVQRLVQNYVRRTSAKKRLCLVAASQFRLWDDSGHVMARATGTIADQVEVLRIDPDDPAESSPLAVAKAAAECDVLVTTNLTRADLPNVLSRKVPWISWMTVPKIPQFGTVGPEDRLMLAESDWVKIALKNGWPAERIHVARWPRMGFSTDSRPQHLAIIADTIPVPACTERFELSSHNLLWELIYSDLSANPFNLGDLGQYISQRMRRLDISEENLDRRVFVDELMTALYQQLIGRALLAAKIPVVVYGDGWDQLPEFEVCWAGAIKSRQQFEQAKGGCAAVVDVWPARNSALEATKAVVRHMGSRESLISNARKCLSSLPSPADASETELSGPLIARVIGLES